MSAENENKESKPTTQMTKEEMKTMIRELAEKLGHQPNLVELQEHTPLRHWLIRKRFGNFTWALRECGLTGDRYKTQRIPMESLFTDWAEVARKLGHIPSIGDFERTAGYRVDRFQRRFKQWSRVPSAMRDYAQTKGLEQEWQDVMELIQEHFEEDAVTAGCRQPASTRKPLAVMSGRPVYGPALASGALVNEPTNEQAVLFLFGAMAMELGFRVKLVQTAFPDCRALREVAPGKWQDVSIEVELESRNFLKHGHRIEDCDLIVCWVNNWPECPIEVIELRTAGKPYH